MVNKIAKIIAVALFAYAFFIGVLSIYRATLTPAAMMIITGKVTDKKIYFNGGTKGGAYYLAFKLEGRQNFIALRLNGQHRQDAENDSIGHLIDTGKIYTFYIDKTYPAQNDVNPGIQKIDYGGMQVFRASNTMNLYGGILICLVSVTAAILVLKTKRRPGIK
jgi:hypothetical protein